MEHLPVLLKEVIDNLNIRKGKRFIDATLGFGGHTEEVLVKGGEILAIEWDKEVLKLAKERLKTRCPGASCQMVWGNFGNIAEIAEKYQFFPVDGVLFDLGISRWHYKKGKRGFSFEDEKLDMRLSGELPFSAEIIVNSWRKEQLYEIFTKFAQERLSRPIAEALVHARRLKKIDSAKMLAEIVSKVYKKEKIITKLHPATKVFLSLRTVVNQELENLEKGLVGAFKILGKNGRILVITFNSNEDRLVKAFFKERKKKGEGRVSKVIFPSEEEVKVNPLSRSAKLRIVEKTI